MLNIIRTNCLALTLILVSAFYSTVSYAQPNGTCTNPYILSPATSCNPVTYSLKNAGTISPKGTCTGTTTSSAYGVWFNFTATAASMTITVALPGGSTGLSTASTYVQYGTNSCGSFAAASCTAISSPLSMTGLVVGNNYNVRVYVTSNPNTANNFNFTICLVGTATPSGPANDDAAGAISLTSGSTCSNTAGNMAWSTASSNTSACTTSIDYDVWYKFVAQTASPVIKLSSVAANFTNGGMELLTGTTASTSIACATVSSGAATINASNVTVGDTLYIRIFSTATTAPPGTTATFNLCITELPSTSPSGEVFKQTILAGTGAPSGNASLNDPWEVTYGPDKALWVTESKGYKVYRFDPLTGAKTTVLDISQNATWAGLTAAEQKKYDVKFAPPGIPNVPSAGKNCWPQGGLAGLAMSPTFATDPVKYVYVSYVDSFTRYNNDSAGVFFNNWLVQFTYDPVLQQLKSPVTICDTLPGGNDHNSQRVIVAPVNGQNYLFYAQGDMGSGQFLNKYRAEYAQFLDHYEGKILRFNLTPDTDPGAYDQWIPNDNPYNNLTPGRQSAVWAFGFRNNQGFAHANINGTDILYGGMQGPYSDDEINIIQRATNYGHPYVMGYVTDNNYLNYSAGYVNSSLPIIKVSEQHNVDSLVALGETYKDPVYSAYPAANSTLAGWWSTTSNGPWATEAWCGMDVYTYSAIPGWKNSLIMASLKKGRLLRFQLNSAGTGIVQTNGFDTVSYFGGSNRFRDLAIDSNGRVIYAIMDQGSTNQGSYSNNPSVATCAGCLIRYDFLGFANNTSNQSSIPTYIPISTTTSTNTCISTSIDTITTSKQNNFLWVPFTGPDGNIVAEVNARGNDLGAMQSSFYVNSGTMRHDSHNILYADRSFKITPTTQPTNPVSVRLYLTNAEFNALKSGVNSNGVGTGISTISDVRVFKNSDACNSQFATTGVWITPTVAQTFGTGGYVLQFDISSFSSFYLSGSSMITLPVRLISFDGVMNNSIAYLNWETETEKNTSYFSLERSTDGQSFIPIAKVDAHGNAETRNAYGYVDNDACLQRNIAVYYRLRVVDINGNYEYSKVIKLQCNATGINVEIYPNPISNVVTLRLDMLKSDNVNIQITDMAGHVMYNKSRNIAAGIEEIQLNTQAWPAGVYSIKVTGITTNVLVNKNVIKQ